MSPVVGSRNPAIMFKRVDLPQPDGPRRQVKLFSYNERSTRSNTVLPEKDFVTPLIEIFVVRAAIASEIIFSPLCRIFIYLTPRAMLAPSLPEFSGSS